MNELVLKKSKLALAWVEENRLVHPSRILLLALLIMLISSSELRPIIFGSMMDAYLAVTVFVGATLALFYMLERSLGVDLGHKMAAAGKWQSPIAAFLGALPGCGGAIIVVTQYTRGYISFGSVVAVLIATMGDAAFLLLAREPITGAYVLAGGLVIGTISGWFVDWYHGSDFLRRTPSEATDSGLTGCFNDMSRDQAVKDESERPLVLRLLDGFWILLIIPSIVIGLALAFQVDVDAWFGPLQPYQPTLWIGATGALLCLFLWALSAQDKGHVGQEIADLAGKTSMKRRVIRDTNFVTSWVVFGFLAYELGVHFMGAGIESWFQTWAPLVPLVAILIGFIPGCGPQIVVTTLYLNGIVPLAGLVGNAIANDGDALFPAIALAPKAAMLATIYSAVPAFIVAYAIYFLM